LQRVEIRSDSGPFSRRCIQLASGTGKTVVMAMVIAWQALNNGTTPKISAAACHDFSAAPFAPSSMTSPAKTD
jgi:type III restriction enzyme